MQDCSPWLTRFLQAVTLLAAGNAYACFGNMAGQGESAAPTPVASPAAPNLPLAGIRRLTQAQYHNSIADLLGSDISLTYSLDADQPLNYLVSLGAGSIATTPQGAQLYDQAARQLAAARFADPNAAAAFVGCAPRTTAGSTDACVQTFISNFGQRAWRRPLSNTEVMNYTRLYTSVAQDANSVWQGLESLTAALLDSPYFIYRPEIGEVQADGSRQLNSFELASRLSYLLWNTTPDDELLGVAAAGGLQDPNVLLTQANRLLASPRASAALTTFFEQWLGFDGLTSLSKDSTVYPQATATLGPAMQAEFDHVVQGLVFDPNQDFTSLFTTRNTWVDAELAGFYGLPAPAGQVFVAAQQPADGPRGGLLTMAGFLAAQAKPDATAPVARGHYVRSRLLCETVPPPPANVPALPSTSTSAPQTMRQRLDAHVANPTCAACHNLMDPAGLALEQFDGIGAYRTTDHGLPIDVSGILDTTPFVGAGQLGELVQQSPEAQTCIVRQLYRQALGQIEGAPEEAALSELQTSFAASQFDYRTLMRNFISSDLFRKAGTLR